MEGNRYTQCHISTYKHTYTTRKAYTNRILGFGRRTEMHKCGHQDVADVLIIISESQLVKVKACSTFLIFPKTGLVLLSS